MDGAQTATGVDFSVVICAYTHDRWDALQRAVASSLRQSLPPREVIVVIDHNPSLFDRAAQLWNAAPVTVVASEGARGLSGARNTGVAIATGTVVAFLDDDAEADDDWLAELATAYEDAAIVAVGGEVRPRFASSRPTWWPPEFDWVIGCSYRGLPSDSADVRNVIGANMSLRREPVLAAGGFAEDLGRVGRTPLGCEETDLCIRLQDAHPGTRVRYEPRASVRHDVPDARLTLRYFVSRCFSEGISKSQVAARVGGRSALASEKSHAMRALVPAVVGPGGGGPRRRAAVILGLMAAALGFARGHAARFTGDALGVATGSLIANTAVTSILGFVFWGLAARRYSVGDLGVDSALVGAMILLSSVAQLNLDNGLQRLLPQFATRRWRPVVLAYGAASLVSVAAVGVFAVIAFGFDGFAFLEDDRAALLLLVPAVALWSVFALQDAVLVSTRWAPLVPVENAAFGLVKIGLLFAFTAADVGHAVFLSWVVGMALLVVPVNAFVFGVALRSPRGVRATRSETLPIDERRRVGRFLAVDYAAALLSQGGTALLPLLVVASLGKAANAYFYVAFLIAGALSSAANGAANAVIAEGGYDETKVAALLTKANRYFFVAALPAIALLVVAAPVILRLFGDEYARNATAILRLLLIGVVPQAYVALLVAAERVRGNAARVIRIEAAGVAMVLAAAVVGMRLGGLAGLGWAWIAAYASLAVAVSPHSIRQRAIARAA